MLKPPPIQLDMREMLTGDPNRLRYITRYSTSLLLHKENVAEHTTFVALYAMFVAEWALSNNGPIPNISVLEVLKRSLLHDMDEARTGDFQRPFKYRRPEMKKLMDDAARVEFTEMFEAVFPNSPHHVIKLTQTWEDAKNDDLEGRIVEFADYLSVISHLYAEVNCANTSVMQHYASLCQYAHKFDSERFDFIRPLIDQTVVIFKEMMDKAGLKINLEDYHGSI